MYNRVGDNLSDRQTDRQTYRQTDAELRLTSELSSGAKCRGIIGVPITFLDKYNPEQFEIIGLDRYVADNPRYGHRFTIEGKEIYARILIKKIL
ncbi:MAG: adenine-specific methyltransferase EcoRI family protein [Clostridia bacterium]|nr:adenine-specific methyltransferase EcoRI family protein [Clostridia bacterium]